MGRTNGAGTVEHVRRERTGVQSVERTLDILEALVEFGSEAGLVDVSQAVGLPLATVHRLLGTLIRRGYVKQNRDNRKYSLGFRALQMSNDMRLGFSLRLEARPFLRRLMQRSGESANLAVLDDGEVVYIDQAQSSRILRMFTQLGSRVPAHSSASGKAMLAFSPPAVVDGIVRRYGLHRQTPQTITDPADFRKELDRIRAQGYAIDDQEQEDGVRCVAVPVRGEDGDIVASLSVSGPASRLSDAQLQPLVEDILECGDKLSVRFGSPREPVESR